MSKKRDQTRIYKLIAKYFLQGLFYLVPITATIYVIFWLVTELDSLINLDIPGLGIIILFVVVTLVGFLGTHFFVNYLRPFERTIENTPLIKIIYTSLKDMMNAFVGKKRQFKKPVLVKVGDDIERIGFVTKDDLSELNISDDRVAVYLPFSYAISGQLLIVPKENVTPLNASSADVMKMVISGGVAEVKSKDKKVELEQNKENQNDEPTED
ncbi:MAG: hypothetical protein CMP59_12275 [Flavobacteriales bacterium]|nr:hypothetical protein [Flavobacteriales bacterium]